MTRGVTQAMRAWDALQSTEPLETSSSQPELIAQDIEAEQVLTNLLPEHLTPTSQQQSCVQDDVYKFTALALANQFNGDSMPDWLLMDAEDYVKNTSFGARKRFFTENHIRIRELTLNPSESERALIAHARHTFANQPRKRRKLDSTFKSVAQVSVDDLSVFGQEGRNVIVWFPDATPPRYIPGEVLKHDHHHYNIKWADTDSLSRVQINMPEPGLLGHKENTGSTALSFRFVDASALINGVSFERLWNCCHSKFHE